MSKYIIIVEADMNDADYIEKTVVEDKLSNVLFKGSSVTLLDLLRSIKKGIKKYPNHNYDNDDHFGVKNKFIKYISKKLNGVDVEELEDMLYYYIPTNGDYPVHTIKSLNVYSINEVIL